MEYIIIDGGSTDGSLEIINRYRPSLSHFISEPDNGPADALNKGLGMASGEVVAWLNADDCYFPGALKRVAEFMNTFPDIAFCFGRCPIVNEKSEEIRTAITRFKESFFPISSQFMYKCINYISQPTLFFRRDALRKAGALDEAMVAAWDYKFVLGLWRYGTGKYLTGPPLAKFRWYERSISGLNFPVQFKEEYEAVKEESGVFHPAVIIHYIVRWLIVGAYSAMAQRRRKSISTLKG